MNQPLNDVKDLYLFQWFQTQQDYERFKGSPCPPYDPSKMVKNWFDPNALSGGVNPNKSILYSLTFNLSANGSILLSEDYKPFVDMLLLTRGIAATVNIPPTSVSSNEIIGIVPCPMRPLRINEEWFVSLGGIVQVRDKTYSLSTPLETGFTQVDRQILSDIVSYLSNIYSYLKEHM